MKRMSVGILLIGISALLSGCIITDNYDEYERKQFQSTEEISEIVIEDISTEITMVTSSNKEVLVDYSDSPKDSWYRIEISNGILNIKKTRKTVGVEDSTMVVSLPEKEYQNFSIETTNGDIILDNTTALTYKCSTENADIKGSLKGVEADYLIIIAVQNGKSNLENNVNESSKMIEFNVKNGDVNVKFVRDYSDGNVAAM